MTERQYEELRMYADGNPRWISGGPPSKPLTRNGWLAIVPGSGHDRASSLFRITPAGSRALAAFETKHGIQREVEA